jgi:hypothetical protein
MYVNATFVWHKTETFTQLKHGKIQKNTIKGNGEMTERIFIFIIFNNRVDLSQRKGKI